MARELEELYEGLRAEFSAKLLDGQPVLAQSNLDVMARIVSFLQFSNEAGISSLEASITPSRANGVLLDGYGETFGVNRLQASNASGQVTISGTAGSVLPIGTVMTRCDGAEYITTEQVTIVGGTQAVSVEASETGPSSNFLDGGTLDVGSVIPGIDSIAISQGIIGGQQVECDDDYRTRILTVIRQPCRVGTCEDYEFWVRQYPGVTRVCCLGNGNGPGTIKLYFMMDDTYANGVPSPADVDAVQEALFAEGGFAPLGIVGEVCAPEPCEIDVAIRGVGSVSDDEYDALLAAVENSFLDFFNCENTTVCRADIDVALRSVLTDVCFEVTQPSANVNLGTGKVPVVGEFTVV